LGDALHERERRYAARWYRRQSQHPEGEMFRTKTILAVEWLR